MRLPPVGSNCPDCPLKGAVPLPFVAGSGDPNSPTLIVGEAPGYQEAERGQAFVGRSGQLLRTTLRNVGVDLSQVFFENTVVCRPTDSSDRDRPPSPREIKACKPHIWKYLEDHSPGLIVLLGNTAMKAILGEAGITDKRGRLVEKDGRVYLPTFHPAAILRDVGKMELFQQDLGMIKEFLSGKQMGANPPAHEFLDAIPKLGAFRDKILASGGPLAVDFETTGLNPFADGFLIVTANLCGPDLIPAILPIAHPRHEWGWESNLAYSEMVEILGGLLTNPRVTKLIHNHMFDSYVSRVFLGYSINPVIDTLFLHYTQNPEVGKQGLKVLARNLLRIQDYSEELDIWMKENVSTDKRHDYSQAPLDILCRYGAMDAYVLHLLVNGPLKGALTDERCQYVLNDIIYPASKAFLNMQIRGMKVDKEKLTELEFKYPALLEKLDIEIKSDPAVTFLESETGKPLNLRSPAQIRLLLYGVLGLTPPSYTDKTEAPSTAKEALEQLERKHPIPKLLLEHRSMAKVYDTYVKPFRSEWLNSDGFVHPHINMTGTVTLRVSVQDPPLHGVPTRNTNDIKSMFVSRFVGGKIVTLDYEQMEMRMVASLSDCEFLIETFKSGVDVHTATAALILNKKVEDVTEAERYRGKTQNFAILYGRGPGSIAADLSRMTGKEVYFHEAVQFLEDYFEKLPEIKLLMDRVDKYVQKNGYIQTPFKHRRPLPNINNVDDEYARAEASRQALNSLIQSSSSCWALMALAELDTTLVERGFKSMIVFMQHDSISLDVHPGEEEEVVGLAKKIMENPSKTPFHPVVPMLVSVKSGPTWS